MPLFLPLALLLGAGPSPDARHAERVRLVDVGDVHGDLDIVPNPAALLVAPLLLPRGKAAWRGKYRGGHGWVR
jgi:hypothetical protein